MDVELLDAPEVSKRLKRLIDKHDEIHVAVAWGYNGPVADRLLQNVHKFRSVTFGIAFCRTDPNLIDRLVGTKNAFIADGGSATFHPKLYYFRSGDIAEAIVGSSNFTAGGLSKNWEASLHVKGHVDAPIFAQVRVCLEAYRPLRKSVTAAMAKSYRLQFDAAKALSKLASLPSTRNNFSLGMVISESTYSPNS